MRLGPPRRPGQLAHIATCGAEGCNTQGIETPGWRDGEVYPEPPAGWGEIDMLTPDGDLARLFVCSPACERRLYMKLAAPKLGEI